MYSLPVPSLVDLNEDIWMGSIKVVEELLEILRDIGDLMRGYEGARVLVEGSTASSISSTSITGLGAGTGTNSDRGKLGSSSLGKTTGIGSNGPTDTAAPTTIPRHKNR